MTLGLKFEWPVGAPRGQDSAVAFQGMRGAGTHGELKDCGRFPCPRSSLLQKARLLGSKMDTCHGSGCRMSASGSFQSFYRGNPAVSYDLGVSVGGGKLKVLVPFSLASSLQNWMEFRATSLHQTLSCLILVTHHSSRR